eukprot:377083-Karenia_brevis.AAC.1
MGMAENRFNEESEDERPERESSTSSTPAPFERRPVGAPRDYRKRDLIAKKEEEDDIPIDELWFHDE